MAVTGAAGYITAAAAAGSAGYGIYAAEQASHDKPKLPVMPVEPPKPKVSSFSTDLQKSQLLAASAGGTILSDQDKNRRAQIGNDPNAVKKTLLGT